MKKELFKGVATAMVTPFKDGNVDYKTLKLLAEYQVDRGIDALVVCGTTGEAPTLSALEKLRCVSAVAEAVGGKVPIIAGTATNDTGYSSRLSALACREGADAVLAVTPYYNKPTSEGLVKHFLSIADACGKPLIVYNIPSRACCEINDAVYLALAESGAVCGIKEASGSVSRAAELILKFGDALPLYSGNDDLTLPLLSIGSSGIISVASNVFPLEMHTLCSLWFDGRHDECKTLYYELLPFFKALFAETNPIPVKAIMEKLGFISGEIRLPLTSASEKTVKLLEEAAAPLLGK